MAFIKEFSNILFLRNVGGCFYLDDSNAIYDLNAELIFENTDSSTVMLSKENIWLSNYDESCSLEFDLKSHSLTGNKKPYFYSNKTAELNGSVFNIQSVQGDKVRGLEKYDLSHNLIGKVENKAKESICLAGNRLILREAGKNSILAYDESLNLSWKLSTKKRCFAKAPNSLDIPRYSKAFDLVVVNLGENRAPPRGDFEINAYHAETGELAWQQIVSTTPDCSALYGDKVYAIVSGDIIILDAAAGSILHQVAHGLNDPKDDYPMANFIYPCQQGLMLVSPKHGLVQIRTVDGLIILQNIHVPLPYTTSFHPPITYEGKTYLSLIHADSYDNTMKGAILVLENYLEINDEQAQKGIVEIEAQIAPRPPTLVELIKNESGDDVYQVSIEHYALKSNAASKTLDDLIRFSTIALKETAFKYGSYTSSTETNKNHHGRLLLSVKSGGLQKTTGLNDEELLEKLEVIKERVERNLADTGVQAGDGSNAFVVEIKLVE